MIINNKNFSEEHFLIILLIFFNNEKLINFYCKFKKKKIS
jgi:hypothetical protein